MSGCRSAHAKWLHSVCLENVTWSVPAVSIPAQVIRNFHFEVPGSSQYKPDRYSSVLRVAFFLRERFLLWKGGSVAPREDSKIAEACLFNAFHKHFSDPHLLVRMVSSP
jgi:hypothetical protein